MKIEINDKRILSCATSIEHAVWLQRTLGGKTFSFKKVYKGDDISSSSFQYDEAPSGGWLFSCDLLALPLFIDKQEMRFALPEAMRIISEQVETQD